MTKKDNNGIFFFDFDNSNLKLLNYFCRNKTKFMKASYLLKGFIISLFVFGSMSCKAHTFQSSFSIASLNVDGLPGSILGININPDAPMEDGSVKIGQYLAKKSYDIIAFQEDFNYHQQISQFMTDYSFASWLGGVGLEQNSNIAPFIKTDSLSQFDTDGLGLAWLNSAISVSNENRVKWISGYGYFDHGSDLLIIKGFRSYTVTFNNVDIDVINLHMDANYGADGEYDIQARNIQWHQLLNAIKSMNNGRPKIIIGDTNSLYIQDDIEGIFFNGLKAEGYQVFDAWKESKNSQPESLDKIIYINPPIGNKLILNSYKQETDYNSLGDHDPVVAEFSITEESVSDIALPTTTTSTRHTYNLSGQRVDHHYRGIVIKQGKKKILQ